MVFVPYLFFQKQRNGRSVLDVLVGRSVGLKHLSPFGSNYCIKKGRLVVIL